MITACQQHTIEQIANLIRQYCSASTPIEINPMCKCLNINIRKDSSIIGIIYAPIHKSTSNIDAPFTILTDPTWSPEQQKYQVCRSIGHLVMHLKYLSQTIPNDCQIPRFSGEQEQQATWFALSLLMPKTEFIQQMMYYTDNQSKIHTDDIAKHFGVSTSEASCRGKLLGFFKW